MDIERFFVYSSIAAIGALLVSLVFCIFIAPFTGFCRNYSEGARAGTIQKFSKKGIFWKTYEGDLYMGMTTGEENTIVANIFHFSLPENADKSLVKKLEYANTKGDRVKVKYDQWIISPSSQGSSSYIISSVELSGE